MANVNIENVIKHIDFQKIKEEKKNGKSLEEILKGIDLKPIIREEMVKINPDVQDEEIESVVKEIDLIKVLGSILENENVSKEIAGKFFEDLSEEEMTMLQGAGDVDVEVYQILALDLDGTLTNSQKEITKPTLDALIEIQEAGKKVVLASGRPTKGVVPLAQQLHLEDYGSYILSFNGGRITDCRTKKAIYNKILPADCAKGIYETVIKYAGHGVDILTYTSEHILSGIHSNQYTELESRINQMPIIDVGADFLDVIPDDPNKFLVTGDPDILDQIRKELSKQFHSYLSVYCSDPFFVEVMPAGIDKAHSLLKLLTSIGLTADEMICCGDGYNDLTMIETAGLGVAMANAQPAVLDKADYITKSNDEDGVLHVINEFMR